MSSSAFLPIETISHHKDICFSICAIEYWMIDTDLEANDETEVSDEWFVGNKLVVLDR